MKRIALITEDLSAPLDEGFKKASAELADAISGLGIEVVIFTAGASDQKDARSTLPRNKLLAGRGFARNLRTSKPDVVIYIPQAAATPMSILRSRMLGVQSGGVPVVLVSLQRRVYPAAFRPVLRMMSPALVLVLSKKSEALMHQAGLRACRIPLGVDTDRFRPASLEEKSSLRKRYGIPDGKIILHVGHVSVRRNLEVLVRIAAGEARLVVVSSTSTTHHAEVKDLIAESSVTWIDRYVPSIDEIYRLADGYVFPTFNPKGAIEIPLSVLEAMASNLPVVTTDFGAIPDLFESGNGLSICHTNEDLVEASRDMFAEGHIATRDKVQDLTWSKVAEQVMGTIEQGLA